MAVVTRYPTKPLECWGKMKELRRKLFRRSWDVKKVGGVVVATQQPCYPLVAGLGPFGRRLYGPYFGKAMKDTNILVQYHEVADAAGFPRGEMCSSMHHYIGEMLLGLTTKDPITGGNNPVDFILDMEFCPSIAKTAQLAGEILGVPHFVLDIPQQPDEVSVEYVAAQMYDATEWMERVTGKKYQDELVIQAVQNWWERGALCARIIELNKAVPAPLEFRQLGALMVPGNLSGYEREGVEFCELALAEVEERVKQGISAVGIETCRLTHEGEPMFYAEDFIHKLARQYGAVFVAGFVVCNPGLWQITQDGRWTPVPRFGELGITLSSREDALRLLARMYVIHNAIYRCNLINEKAAEYLHRAQDWKCDGAILLMDIGCRSQGMGQLEAKQVLEENGIPTVTYESSNGDSRDFAPGQVTDRLESFLERLGLVRLPEFAEKEGADSGD